MGFVTSANFPSTGKPKVCTPPFRKVTLKATPVNLRKTKDQSVRRHTPNKETRETIEKALCGEDVYGPVETYEEMIAFLDS